MDSRKELAEIRKDGGLIALHPPEGVNARGGGVQGWSKIKSKIFFRTSMSFHLWEGLGYPLKGKSLEYLESTLRYLHLKERFRFGQRGWSYKSGVFSGTGGNFLMKFAI